MQKIISIINLFRKGYIVANPTAWKKGQITVGVLSAVFVAVGAAAKAFGYELPITEHEANAIAGGLLALVGLFNTAATVVSSEKVGVLPKGNSNQPKPASPLTGQREP